MRWEFSTDAYVQFLFDRDIFDDTLTLLGDLSEHLRALHRAGLRRDRRRASHRLSDRVFHRLQAPNQRNLWLFLITLPFWVNLLIRTYAILLIIRDEGIINLSLMWTGAIDRPIGMLYTDTRSSWA